MNKEYIHTERTHIEFKDAVKPFIWVLIVLFILIAYLNKNEASKEFTYSYARNVFQILEGQNIHRKPLEQLQSKGLYIQ